jgi:hypothetical protein
VPVRARNSAWPKSHGGSTVAEMWQQSCPGARVDEAGDMGQNFCRLKFVIPHRATGTVGARRRNAAGMPAERKTPAGTPPEAGGKKDLRVFSSAQKGGGVEQNRTRTRAVPEILHWRTRPNFLAKFFWKKFLEIKIAGQRSWHRWSFLATHVATPPATAPSLAQDIFCTQVGPPCSLACQPSISCSWRRSSL